MKYVSVSNAVVLLAILIACGMTIACGGGSNNASFPIVSVAATQNPLVANFTIASPCAGQAAVEFGPDTSYGRNTASYPIPGGLQRTSILVAGMRASTKYHMRAQVDCAGGSGNSQDLTFTTGSIPTSTAFPGVQVTRPSGSTPSAENAGIEMIEAVAPGTGLMQAFFTDRDANPIWYYNVDPGFFPFTIKLLPNGHMIFTITGLSVLTLKPGTSILREVDLAGNTVREMDIHTLESKMQNKGFDFVPIGYHHDVVPLDNGHLIVLVDCAKNFTNLTGTTTLQGDAIVDLDENWNPVWGWNSFDYLDPNRHLGGLPDWTHANGLVYLPNDGNLLLSMRHQSWVIKIEYSNGAGTGRVIWKLGNEGDFTLAQGTDASLWFSFQHFPSLISQTGSQIVLAVWDNGDNRILSSSGELCINPLQGNAFPACYSRATIFQIDESAMVANLAWSYIPTDGLPGAPGLFSIWGGSINQLANGNVEFDVNGMAIPPSPNVGAEVQEVTGTSNPQVIWKMDIVPIPAYRAYRWPSLYPGVTWQY